MALDGTTAQADFKLTWVAVTSAVHTITVSFDPAHGSISPSGPTVSVVDSENQTFTITATAGYVIGNVVVDGVSQGAISTYTFKDVTADHTISATFIVDTGVTYTITTTAGTGGSIQPANPVVHQGATQVLKIIPNNGYQTNDVKVDSVSQGAIANYTFSNVQAAHTVAAVFAPGSSSSYTITVTSGSGGTVTPSGTVTVNAGATQVFQIAPNSGYHTVDVKVDSISQGAIGTYTFSNVQSNHALAATFASDNGVTYTITATATSGGTISPLGTTTVNAGTTQVYQITAYSGYHIVDVQVDGVSYGAIGTYTFTNIVASHTIAASFASNTGVSYTITASAGSGGSISPVGSVVVNQGATQVFTITPISGYHIVDVVVDSVSQGAVATYTFTNVQANHVISATFAANTGVTFTITASAGTGGTITPTGAVVVQQGATQVFTIAQDSGNHIVDVKVDGASQGAVTRYTFSNVQATHTIAATFATGVGVTYTITATAGSGGTITPSGAVSVTQGATQVFSIAPNSGYYTTNVLVDGVSMGAIATYTFTNVQTNHAIQASFASSGGGGGGGGGGVTTYTITVSAGTGGTITPAGPSVTVNQGATQVFYIAPNSGYHIVGVTVDGVAQGAIGTYTFSNVQANHAISATFASGTGVTYAITATAGTGGTITPSGVTNVPQGGSQSYSIAANSGNHIVDVVVDGVSQGAIGSYTFTNVQATHTISATFAVNNGVAFVITASAGTGGSISPSGSVVVNEGATQVFTISPLSGYVIGNVVVDGVSQGAIARYTFTNVQSAHTIVASFVTNTGVAYTITATAGAGGFITPSGAVVVNQGATQVFTIAGNTGYDIANVQIDGVSLGAVTSYTFNNVQSNHQIAASFVH